MKIRHQRIVKIDENTDNRRSHRHLTTRDRFGSDLGRVQLDFDANSIFLVDPNLDPISYGLENLNSDPDSNFKKYII